MDTDAYYQLPQKILKRDGIFYFFLRNFLLAREALGADSNQGFEPAITGLRMNDMKFEEDVNMYIAGLLFSFMTPLFHEREARYVRETELGVAQLVNDSTDRAFKFLVYRSNADHLLMKLSLFDFFREDPVSSAQQIKRGSRYYAFAAGYAGEIDRRRSARLDVMEKMSVRFNEYLVILSEMTRKCLEFIQHIRPAEESRILRESQRAIDYGFAKIDP
jgi:hypothetical protein